MTHPDRSTLNRALTRLTRAAWSLADNADEGPSDIVVTKEDYAELCAALDQIDALPDVPGFIMEAGAKAEYWLKHA